jgi:hypothetical protein
MPDDKGARPVGRILHDVFLLGNSDKEVGALSVCNLLFDMVRRQHTLKMTNSLITESLKVIAQD